jgi:CHASE3 domain sensor protein
MVLFYFALALVAFLAAVLLILMFIRKLKKYSPDIQTTEQRRKKRLAAHQNIDARLRQKHRLVDEVIGVDRVTSDNPQYEWPAVPYNDKK